MNSILIKITETVDDFTLFVMRVILSVVIFPHGAQKLIGWFEGKGLTMTIELWEQWWNMPVIVTISVVLIEFFGMIFLMLGLFSRIMAGLIFAVMLGAIYMVHGQYGFFMNWYSEMNRGEGFEYHLLVLAIAFMIIIKGAGKWSLDQFIQKKVWNRMVIKS